MVSIYRQCYVIHPYPGLLKTWVSFRLDCLPSKHVSARNRTSAFRKGDNMEIWWDVLITVGKKWKEKTGSCVEIPTWPTSLPVSVADGSISRFHGLRWWHRAGWVSVCYFTGYRIVKRERVEKRDLLLICSWGCEMSHTRFLLLKKSEKEKNKSMPNVEHFSSTIYRVDFHWIQKIYEFIYSWFSYGFTLSVSLSFQVKSGQAAFFFSSLHEQKTSVPHTVKQSSRTI